MSERDRSRDAAGIAPRATAPSRCSEVQNHLLHAHHPADALPTELGSHLEACEACRTFRTQLVGLDAAVLQQAPELPDGFELALRRRLKNVAHSSAAAETPRLEAPVADKVAHARRRTLWFALSAAAVVLVVAGSLLLLSRWPHSEAETYHRLRLSIESTRNYDAVLFTVDLPPGVRLLPATGEALGPGRTWQSPLRRGINEIDLPLAARQTDGVVRVHLRVGAKIVTRSVGFAHASTKKESGDLRLAWLMNEPDAEEGRP
jgi:hypothetical protein